ncbi:DUF4032 domain-containing protein [Ktedonosporobacter rubrisoli]|uniref:DUF4032 domain-containing protein n=1 Tax=Ktedonosporobacter rubrisoli TaxID=2509675 RepID=A0A4P6K213_KTERU|nr:DUF4032 domain-containing protein [Ktedonosporobacter rubrisoli]QBD82164.1 DUF4032 domain-containing protein [Ktedonosporobacter rubrisoli]
MNAEHKRRLEGLPWHVPLEGWPEQGVKLLIIRRGESRHPVVFVERMGIRYAIKETTPHMAEREIRNLREVNFRGIPTLTPIGSVTAPGQAIPQSISRLGGLTQYISGDRGYTVTQLAPRVIPHSLLYRIPFTRRTKQRLLSAVAVLMVELHEHGIYWGDPSLANVLIRIDGKTVLGIMADAETAEIFPGAVSEGLRQQDLAAFGESLAWQAEDLRQAHGLPENEQMLDDSDFRYFMQRYRWLRREHLYVADQHRFSTFYQAQKFLRNLNRWGFSLLSATGYAVQHLTTVMPGWYQRRIHELLHITVPRIYARRFYNMILGHQMIMAEQQKRDVSIEEAARHWYTRYHLPAILLLRRHLTKGQDPMKAYFAVMDYKWKLSQKAGYEVPLDEALLAWSMQRAETGSLGEIDPALLAKWWRELEPAAEVLEPPMIQTDELEPLLSTQERPLVRLNAPELEQKLPEILEQTQPNTEKKT